MAIDTYTHDFIYQLGDGSKFMVGEVEFNHDKKVTYRFSQIAEPLDHELMQAFHEFVDRVKIRFDTWDGLKLVEVREKGYISPYE